MDEKKYVAVPYEYREEMEELTDEEFGRLIRALMLYSEKGTPITTEGNERFFAKRVARQEDRYKASYNDISAARSEAGRAGAAARWQNNQRKANTDEDDNDMANDSKNGKGILPLANDDNDMANDSNGCTDTVIDTVTGIDIDITVSDETVCRTCDVRRVQDEWNQLGLSRVNKILPDTDRGKMLRKRIKDYGIDTVIEAIHKVGESAFLMGNKGSGWQATFDWFIRPNNFPKVLDGNYDDNKRGVNAPKNSGGGRGFADIAREEFGYGSG